MLPKLLVSQVEPLLLKIWKVVLHLPAPFFGHFLPPFWWHLPPRHPPLNYEKVRICHGNICDHWRFTNLTQFETRHSTRHSDNGTNENLWVKQMQPMWLCIVTGSKFEDPFENTQCRKVKQMQSVRLYILLCKCFEDTCENAQWRKVKQMQPMWLCIFLCKRFEDPF